MREDRARGMHMRMYGRASSREKGTSQKRNIRVPSLSVEECSFVIV